MAELNNMFRAYPSDRQLILRSKINVGWSVHTYNVFRRSQVLSESEIDLILEVISRSKEIDTLNKQRIGNLVERLENIKRNTHESGLNSCAMCGVPFKRMWSPVLRCYDCAKPACNKCCVDILSVAHDPCMLCKICAEDRELWKKSGGWFYGSIPIRDETRKNMTASPNSGRATWEHTKIDIVRCESFEATQSENNSEILLKSSWANLQAKKGGYDDEPESPEIFEMKTTIFKRTNSGFLKPFNENMRREASYQNLAAPEMNSNLLPMSSLSTSCPLLVPHEKAQDISSHQSTGILEFSVMYNSKAHILQCTIYSVKELKPKEKEDEMIRVTIQLIPFTKKMNPLRTKSVKKDTMVQFNETLVFPKIRKELLKKQMLHLQVVDEDPFDVSVIGEVGVDLTELKAEKNKFFTLPLNKHDSEMQKAAGCGRILLSLRYSPEAHSLVLGVISCSDLVASNKNGLLNSFVSIKLLPENSGVKFESAVKHKTLNPTFNEEFTFNLSPLEMKSKSIMVSVFDKTGKRNQHIGHVMLGIQARDAMLQHWLDVLQKPKVRIQKCHTLLAETN